MTMSYNIKIILRILLRNPVFTFIIIPGFALSLSVALLLASFIFSEREYDKSIPGVDNIYRLCVQKGVTTLRGDIVDDIRNKYPEVEFLCRYDNGLAELSYENEPCKVNSFVKTDNDFFRIFSVNLIAGDTQDPLPDNQSIAVSSDFAKMVFGNSDPIGKAVIVQNRKEFVVSAVFEDLPQKSSIQAQAIVTWENVNDLGGEWRSGIFYSRYFFKLYENSDPVLLAGKLTTDYSEDHYSNELFRLFPFKKSYLSPITAGTMGQTLHADLQTILLLSLVTLLIIFVSVLNFIILFTSNHLNRIKEIGVRKVAGADRKTIFRQFILEAIIISIVAFALGIYLSFLLETPFSKLIQTDLQAMTALKFPNILVVIPGILIIGFLSGFYPAAIISKVKPASIFGESSVESKMKMRNGLSLVQYLITIVMIVSIIAMTRQNNLLINKNIGFSKEQIITINAPWEIKEKLPVLKQKLQANPHVKSCAVSHGIPGKVSLWNMWGEPRDKYGYNGQIPCFTVDPDFFKVYNVEFLQGRDFDERDWKKSVIINETAFRLIGKETIEDLVLRGIPRPEQAFGKASREATEKNSIKVIGVIKDINVEKLNEPVKPTVFECSDNFGISYLSCSFLPGAYQSIVSDIRKIWEETCPGVVFNYNFYDEWLNSLYKSEMHSAYVLRVFTILSIILSCLGTFGIIHFVSRMKTRETGIRKVHGAKISDIIVNINHGIIIWIAAAYILAIPLSYFLIRQYLKGFAFRIKLSWWIFALAGLIVLAIALLTVSWQSWRAATRNPVEALRYE